MTNADVIDVETLAARIAAGRAVVIDARFDLADAGRGERDYRDGHIAGAVYAHLDRDLSDLCRRGEGRHPLPEQAALASTLARWGLATDDDIVIYDDAAGALAAARLWWLLRIAGFARVAVLDGGFAAWLIAGGSLATEPPAIRPDGPLDLRLDRDRIVWYAELEERRLDPKSLVIDARGAPRFRGESEPIDVKAGHVPGSVNRPFTDNLDQHGHFKSASTLRAEFIALLAGRDPRDVVHLCGSGVTACHNALAMARAGLVGSRVFAPSWSGWIDDARRPIATGHA